MSAFCYYVSWCIRSTLAIFHYIRAHSMKVWGAHFALASNTSNSQQHLEAYLPCHNHFTHGHPHQAICVRSAHGKRHTLHGGGQASVKRRRALATATSAAPLLTAKRTRAEHASNEAIQTAGRTRGPFLHKPTGCHVGNPLKKSLQGSFNHKRHNSHALHDCILSFLRNLRRQSCNHMNRGALNPHDWADRCKHMI
jgi:hypothetical protein